MVALEQHLYQTIVLLRKLATGSIHDYICCYCPLVGKQIMLESKAETGNTCKKINKRFVSINRSKFNAIIFNNVKTGKNYMIMLSRSIPYQKNKKSRMTI